MQFALQTSFCLFPAMHNSLVTPPLEVLFIHLDSYCQGNALSMVGVYFCNQRLGDSQ
jgi:hypothetical protein